MAATKKSVAAKNVDPSRKARAKIHVAIARLRSHLAAGGKIPQTQFSTSRGRIGVTTRKDLMRMGRAMVETMPKNKATRGSVAAAQAHMTMRGSRVEIGRANRAATNKAHATMRAARGGKSGGGGGGSRSEAARKAWVTRKRGKA